MKRRKAFLKEERQIQIVNHAVSQYRGDMRVMFTTSEAAKWIDLSATQTRKLLEDLVRQNVLQVEFEFYPGVCGKRKMYRFTEKYIVDREAGKYNPVPGKKRMIKVNRQQVEFEGAL